MREKMSKQAPPAPTASTVGPSPTCIQISGTPRYWKFIQFHRTTRPLQEILENVKVLHDDNNRVMAIPRTFLSKTAELKISHATRLVNMVLSAIADNFALPDFNLLCLFVALLFYVHSKHLRSCRDGQLT